MKAKLLMAASAGIMLLGVGCTKAIIQSFPKLLSTAPAGVPSILPVVIDAQGLHQRIHYSDSLGPGAGFRLSSLAIDLSQVSLATTAAQPGQEVLVNNVPLQIGTVRVAIFAPDNSVYSWAMIRNTGVANQIAFPLPPLPSTVLTRGMARFAVNIEGTQGPILTLKVNPLPAAPANQGFGATIQAIAKMADNDPLMGGGPSPISPTIHAILDNPSNPNSIAAIAAGTAPILEGTQSIAPATIDAMLAGEQVVNSLSTFSSAMQGVVAAIPISSLQTQSLSTEPAALKAAVSLMKAQVTAQATLENALTDYNNGLTATIAAIASSVQQSILIAGPTAYTPLISNAIDLAASLNLASLTPVIQSAYDTARLPSRVNLQAVSFTGGPSGKGLTFYPWAPRESTGSWTVSGTITNAPVKIDPGALQALLEVPSQELISLYDSMATIMTLKLSGIEASNIQASTCNIGLNAWNFCENNPNNPLIWFYRVVLHRGCGPAPVCGAQVSLAPYQNILGYLQNSSEQSIFSDLSFNPTDDTLSLGQTIPYYSGDLTSICYATSLTPGILEADAGDNNYHLLGGNAVAQIRIHTTTGIPGSAQTWAYPSVTEATTSVIFNPSTLIEDGVPFANLGPSLSCSTCSVPNGIYSLDAVYEPATGSMPAIMTWQLDDPFKLLNKLPGATFWSTSVRSSVTSNSYFSIPLGNNFAIGFEVIDPTSVNTAIATFSVTGGAYTGGRIRLDVN